MGRFLTAPRGSIDEVDLIAERHYEKQEVVLWTRLMIL